MKKITILALVLALTAAMFGACSDSKKSGDEAKESSAQSDVSSEKASDNKADEVQDKKDEDQKNDSTSVIKPLETSIDINNLQSCTVPVALEEGDAFVDDEGAMQMKVKVFDYDLYDMVDIANLKTGDTIVYLGEELEVTSVDRDGNWVVINGGLGNGGFDLYTDESGVYFELGYNDAKSFNNLGTVTLRVSPDFVFTDESDLEAGSVEYYPGDFLLEETPFYFYFDPQSTELVIEDGVIVAMTRSYTP